MHSSLLQVSLEFKLESTCCPQNKSKAVSLVHSFLSSRRKKNSALWGCSHEMLTAKVSYGYLVCKK